LFDSLPERQKQLLRLVADGLSDAEIAEHLNERELVVGREIQGILTELGFRTRTHAIVYVLAREISGTAHDPRPRAPVEPDVARDRDDIDTQGSEERPA
jgi:DNA-binding CsgD family transcriptional regulator